MTNIIQPTGQPEMALVATKAIATPINDVQLVALIAAQLWPHIDSTPASKCPKLVPTTTSAVRLAIEIFAEAVVQQANIGKRIKELRGETE